MNRLNKIAFVLICATVVVTTLLYGTVHQPIIALFYLMVTALLLLWAIECFFTGSLRYSHHPLQLPLILFGIYALIQTIPLGTTIDPGGVSGISRTISLEPFATNVTALHIFALAVFFSLTLVYLDTAARLSRMVTVITVFGFAYAFFAILQSMLSPDKIYGIYKPNSTPFGTFVNRHNFAALIKMAVSIPLGLLFTGAVRRDKRLLYVIAIALMGASLLLSGSRGGLIALTSAIIFLVIITSRARGRKNLFLKAGLSLLLVIAAVGGAIFVGGETSLTRVAEGLTTEQAGTNRTQIWVVTLKIIGDSMPLGAGIGAYSTAYTQHDTAGGSERVDQAHNDYLQVLADAGIPGLLIGGLFLFLLFREGIRNVSVTNTFRRGVASGAFAGCFAILVHSIFDFVLHVTAISVMFLTLIAMLVAAGREYGDDTEEFDEPHPKHRRSASVTQISGQTRQRSRTRS
jgi:O-antigen ligase